jgi:hypothetical protein
MRFRVVLQRGHEDVNPKSLVVWPRDPISPDLDLRHVHVSLMVRLLLTAQGPWMPEDDTISLSMTTQVKSFTTPVPILGPTRRTVEEDSDTEAWLENAEAVSARHLGTFYDTSVWGQAAFETAMDGADSIKENELQVDVHLLQVCPAGSGTRTFKFAPLVPRAGPFRIGTDNFEWNPVRRFLIAKRQKSVLLLECVLLQNVLSH